MPCGCNGTSEDDVFGANRVRISSAIDSIVDAEIRLASPRSIAYTRFIFVIRRSAASDPTPSKNRFVRTPISGIPSVVCHISASCRSMTSCGAT